MNIQMNVIERCSTRTIDIFLRTPPKADDVDLIEILIRLTFSCREIEEEEEESSIIGKECQQ